MRIEQHQKGEGEFRTTLESLISVASRAADIFERSKPEQKRQLIAFVFSNLRLRGKKLEISLRSPFDLMVNRATYASWLGFVLSNCTWKDGELTANYRQPFDLLATAAMADAKRKAAGVTTSGFSEIWLPGSDSNRRPTG
jgi:hypothetical protein